MSSGGNPEEMKTTLITGMLMLGKVSVGVRSADTTPKIMISIAMTTNVYGRRSASLTMPIIVASWSHRSPRGEPGRAGEHKRRHGERRHGHLTGCREQALGDHDDDHDRNGAGVAEQ